MTEKWEHELGEAIWTAKSAGDVEAILKIAETKYGIKTVPVGRGNNIGTIRMASDPGLALVERVTNGIDALIELEVLLNPGSDPRSPEEAAQKLFGVPSGGLGEMVDKDRRAVAERLVLSFHDSGIKKRPTVRIDDRGLGQHPERFDSTLLSLNEDNKVGKRYTMGTYGQGGSVTFGFSEFTVVASRSHPTLLEGRDDLVGWTVVYEEEGDLSKDMLPYYVWVVKADGTPLSLPPACFAELPHGTRINHVNYDVQNLSGPFQTQAWQFLHATMFDPAIPFLVAGDRTDAERKAKNRVVIGNAARLSNPSKAKGDVDVAFHDTHHLDLGPQYGTVEVSYWALTRPSGEVKDSGAAASYVQATNAVSLTLHGQRQDAERRTWIKDKALLPYLYKNMVVHIDANGLKPRGRRELFASTRERATESELRSLIYDRTAELLRQDGELKRLNHEEKERLLQKSTAATNDKVRKRLGKFIRTKLKGTTAPGSANSGKGAGGNDGGSAGSGSKQKGKSGGGGGSGPGRNVDDTHLPHVPTTIAFDSKFVQVNRDARGLLWVLVDAKNGYLPEHRDDMSVTFTGPGETMPKVVSESKLLGGKSRWAIGADEDVELGYFEMTVELMTANGPLTASIDVVVKEPPEDKEPGPGAVDEDTGPDVRWVRKEDWDEDMGPLTVGRVDEDTDSTIIWVNRDFDLLVKALASSKLSSDQVATRTDRYQYPVACGLWLQSHELKTAESRPDEKYLESELHRLAEAVLVAMDPDVELAGFEQAD